MRHRIKNARLTQEPDQNHRGQAENDAELEHGREPGQPDGIDADGNRIGDVELVVGDDAGEHKAHGDIEHGADDERAQNADRHVALRIMRLLRRGRHGVEADIGEEHYGRAAQYAAQAEFAGAAIAAE